jgi:hypothetical protein
MSSTAAAATRPGMNRTEGEVSLARLYLLGVILMPLVIPWGDA